MAGRPTDRTPEIMSKIEDAAALGASVPEMALYAGIHRTTLSRWISEDVELKDRIEELQERPVLKARQTIVKSLDEAGGARWYLEKKAPKEFGNKSEVKVEATISAGAQDKSAIAQVTAEYEEKLKQVIVKNIESKEVPATPEVPVESKELEISKEPQSNEPTV